MGNSRTSARSAKAPPQDTMEAPLSRCETKEEPTAWCPSSNRLNKEGNYTVPETDAESHAMAPSTTTITLMDGWTTAHTEKLRAAVKDVVAAHPILSGKVVAGEGGKGLAIALTEHKTLDPATLNVAEIFPLNVTIIGHANPTTLICNHNLKPADLKAAARSATLFPKVFKLPTAE